MEEVLQREEVLEEAGGFGYLVDLAQNTASAINISRYAEIRAQPFHHATARASWHRDC